MNEIKIQRALISVTDKSGIADFARRLIQWGVEIISTGGTLKALKDAGIAAKPVSDVTGFPEILDGRVKTLHPKIHAGLLAVTDDPTHQRQLQELNIAVIDLVVVNLYPFEETVSKNGISVGEAIEQIDIGGPAMLRAAAKNFKYKAVVTHPGQYAAVARELEQLHGSVSEETRCNLAQDVFRRTAQYDAAIASYLTSHARSPVETLPDTYAVILPRQHTLRYGENPHQQAALYGDFDSFFEKLHGKELSYNNIVDIQAAAGLAEEFTEPTAVIIKHTNPSGVGSGETLADAYRKAFEADKTSAFGGIVAVNRPLDIAAAQVMSEIFTEVIIASEFPREVLDFLKKKKDRRLIKWRKPVRGSRRFEIRSIAGGILVQTPDDATLDEDRLRVVTKRRPTEREYAAMHYGWRVAKHVKSNAIVYALADRTIGIGAGQMSRLDSSRIAALKAKEAGLDLKGTVVASDAFFPFADGLLEAVKAGATAVIEPGGSMRDDEVIRAADENDIAMVFTGIRHFRHS